MTRANRGGCAQMCLVRSKNTCSYSFIISELNHPTFPMCKWAYNLRFPRMRKPTLRRRHTRDMGTAGTPFNLLFVIPSGNVAKFKAITSENPKNHVLVFSKRIRSIWDLFVILSLKPDMRLQGKRQSLQSFFCWSFTCHFHCDYPNRLRWFQATGFWPFGYSDSQKEGHSLTRMLQQSHHEHDGL